MIDKVVVAVSQPVFPRAAHLHAQQVVVAPGVKHGRFRFAGALVEGVPLPVQFGPILGALDQVTHIDDQVRPQQVHLLDGNRVYPLPLATGQVGEDQEAEFVVGRFKIFVAPWPRLSLDAVREHLGPLGRQCHRARGEKQASHAQRQKPGGHHIQTTQTHSERASISV